MIKLIKNIETKLCKFYKGEEFIIITEYKNFIEVKNEKGRIKLRKDVGYERI